MNKNKSIKNIKEKHYRQTANLIEEAQSFISNIEGNGSHDAFSKPARKLAAKIFKEWSTKLKKSKKLKDRKLSQFLIGLVNYLE